jgi:hypothetical protein
MRVSACAKTLEAAEKFSKSVCIALAACRLGGLARQSPYTFQLGIFTGAAA